MNKNATVYLKDYQPASYTVDHIHLDVSIFDDYVRVINTMTLERQHKGALCLLGDALTITSIKQDGVLLSPTDYTHHDQQYLFTNTPDRVTFCIETHLRPQDNSALSGLYQSDDLLCTQCEAEGFRRITLFPDRPDILTHFSTRISAEKTRYPILLSNGNPVDKGETNDGRHWILWDDPFKKPSYLFALVAGSLMVVRDRFITASGRTITLEIYVEQGHETMCDHAMQSLKHAMRWDEIEYGREYDLDIFMIVAVSHFNMGAMENKGLNIFNAQYILASPETATDQDYIAIEAVVAHEYFHNWTGNRITCRDWFQLSLKEGLTVFREQEFSRAMNSANAMRVTDVDLLRNRQFPEDAGRLAHPVRPESYQEINNFYTATIYEKGAELIRMQQTLLGKEGFRRGMDLYFERYDGQAVTIDDFVSAMEEANNIDLTQFKRWYSQAGTPEVTVQSSFSNNTLTLTLTQYCRPTVECAEKKPLHIPIRIKLYDENGVIAAEDILELQEATQTFHINTTITHPIISLLGDFSAPVILHHTQSETAALALLRYETNGFAKWDIAQRLALTCIVSKTIPTHALIDTFRSILQSETLEYELRAKVCTPPDYEAVVTALKNNVDVIDVENARDKYQDALGHALLEDLNTLYHALWSIEDHRMENTAYGRRNLRNLALKLRMHVDSNAAIIDCKQQFFTARTMTDTIAALTCLVNSAHHDIRENALAAFYERWKHEPLVIDKWFAIQANTTQPDALARVRALLTHPAFDLKNPNRARSLIATFTQRNHRNFHAINGQGYAFLSEMLITLDKINPQVSARLATPFTRWESLDTPRQTLIRGELERLSALSLSHDLREVVDKSG